MIRPIELIVDNFAGGGGASTGIEAATGRSVDIAINHDREAIAMHQANHPLTRHYCESVFDVNPQLVTGSQPVGLAWFSPDCTYHSKARGGKPHRDRNKARRIRGLAGVVIPWIKAKRPRVIMLENVPEFADWGPLLPDGKPDPLRRELNFRRWHKQIENLGYRIDMRELRASDYGAPTSRKRLFVIARCDGQEVVFPEATHGPWSGALPYRTAAECIDWSIPCPSIFERTKPLADATLRRIARGVMRYVVNNPQPFIVTLRGTEASHIDRSASSIVEPLRTISAAGTHHAIVAPSLINTRNGERAGQAPRVRDILQPFPTVTAQGSQGALVAAFLARHYGGHENDGSPVTSPLFTITTKDHHALVSAFLIKYYGTEQDPHIAQPLDTITTRDRFGLVTVRGEQYRIVDIGMRMLTPRELYRAQSFPESYVIDPVVNGRPLPKSAQVRMCGNSVPPAVAEALVRANFAHEQAMREAG